MSMTRVINAIEELKKWEKTKRDLEKMLFAVKRKKMAVKKKIDEIDKIIRDYSGRQEIPSDTDGRRIFPGGGM